ncbi:TetR/AcrR family transcriptional regulator [Vibrio proteolyticus]
MSKRAQTRERILQAAWQLFAESGYEETTTRQIARQAGVADGTVFSHFPNKLTLLREGMLSQLTQLSQQALTQHSGNGEFDTGMHLARTYYQYYFANVALSRALLKEVIWDLEYYQNFNQQLFDHVSQPPALKAKLPLLMDCYFMTLIRHLSKPDPDVSQALHELESKYRQILASSPH